MRYETNFRSIRDQVSAEEWQARVDLAACYRLVDYYGMTESYPMVANYPWMEVREGSMGRQLSDRFGVGRDVGRRAEQPLVPGLGDRVLVNVEVGR